MIALAKSDIRIMPSQAEMVIKVINLPVCSVSVYHSFSFLAVNYRTDFLLF